MRRQKFLLFRVYRFQDTRAYTELYDLYFDKLYRYVFFKLPSGADAEELTSEVFLRGWEYATSSPVENAGALFYRIARNLVADFYRRRDLSEPMDAGMQIAAPGSLVEALNTAQEHEQLVSHLRTLKEEYRDVLIMKYLDEMDIKEIAAVLEKTPNNIRVLLHRAKKALKEIAHPPS